MSTEFGDAVLFERPSPHVAIVTINRPAARNAVNTEVCAGLAAALTKTESDPEIWITVLAGTGEQAFCAGADLRQVAAGGMPALVRGENGFAGFVHAARVKPWIAAIQGSAIAGGFEIALACDLIVASRSAAFGLPEVKRGIVAAAGGLYRLPRIIPRHIANELIMTGTAISAQRAFDLGIVNRLADPGGVIPAALQLAGEVCANAPLAVRESLTISRHCFDATDAQLRALSDQALDRMMDSEDYQEGPRAFLERRSPNWSAR
jgi:enoyl-CoA hydratase/carnithine racemase